VVSSAKDALRDAQRLRGGRAVQMTEHYGTVRLDETRAAMQAAANRLGAASGDRGGDRGEKEKAA